MNIVLKLYVAKIFITFVIVFVLSFIFIYLFTNSNIPEKEKLNENIDKNNEQVWDNEDDFVTVPYDGRQYHVYYHLLTKENGLQLISNFGERITSTEIIEKYKCDFGINGGFYTENTKPLGLFYTDNQMIGEYIDSATFNGFFAKKNNSTYEIIPASGMQEDVLLSSEVIKSDYSFIFQSGPYFDLKTQVQPTFVDEEYARRNIIAIDVKDNIYFFSISDSENRFAGPRLGDITKIFWSEQMQKITEFSELLNVDGGSASAYYSGDKNTKINEITPIGSFLCGKNRKQVSANGSARRVSGE